MNLADAINAAHAADRAFSEAVFAAGFKSRWDVSSTARLARPALQAAYVAKVDADEALHDAFVASRSQAAIDSWKNGLARDRGSIAQMYRHQNGLD